MDRVLVVLELLHAQQIMFNPLQYSIVSPSGAEEVSSELNLIYLIV